MIDQDLEQLQITNESELTPQQQIAASLLATGLSRRETAQRIGVGEATIYRWLNNEFFSAEVDALTFLTGIAVKAERVRLIKRFVASKLDEDGIVDSKKDPLDWLKLLRDELSEFDLSAILSALDRTGDAHNE
jgi:hypothetical protein